MRVAAGVGVGGGNANFGRKNRYVGQIAPALSPDNFNRLIAGVATGNAVQPDDAGLEEAFEYANEDQLKKDEENKKQTLFIEALAKTNADAAVRGMPARNLYQEQGYAGLKDPSQFKKATILPFSEEGASGRNYEGIVNSFDPKLFATSEHLLQQVKSMAPMAQATTGYHGSLYGGISSGYAVNRLYIYNTRNREEGMYAFV